MNKKIEIVTRYIVKVNREIVEECDSVEEAAKKIIDRNWDRINDDIMSRDDVKRDDTLEGYDQGAYDIAVKELEKTIVDSVDEWYSYDDENGHKWSIESVKKVKISDIGLPRFYETELDKDDWGYGESVPTTAGDYFLLRQLNDDGNRDESIRVYEAMSLTDGHCDVVACDNAANWVVGSEDDLDLNKTHFETLESHDVRWNEIQDSNLEDWIEERREAAGVC